MSRAMRPHPIWPSAMVLLGAFSPNTLDGIMVGNATAAPAAFRNVRLELFIGCTPWLTYMFEYRTRGLLNATKNNYIIFAENYIISSLSENDRATDRLIARPIILSFHAMSLSLGDADVFFQKIALNFFGNRRMLIFINERGSQI